MKKVVVKARVWIGEDNQCKYRYVSQIPVTEDEVRVRMDLPETEKLTPKADRRMINNGIYKTMEDTNKNERT